MYGEGRGVPQDYSEAIKWFRLAAEQGNAKAQFHLGVMYANGQGVTQDYAAAKKFNQLQLQPRVLSSQRDLIRGLDRLSRSMRTPDGALTHRSLAQLRSC
jgi:uncharacterized protein